MSMHLLAMTTVTCEHILPPVVHENLLSHMPFDQLPRGSSPFSHDQTITALGVKPDVELTLESVVWAGWYGQRNFPGSRNIGQGALVAYRFVSS